MSDKIYKVAVAGLIHGHIGGLLNNWHKHPNAEIVAVAEPDDALARAAQDRFGIPNRYTDWREMMAAGGFDILQIGSDNAQKTEMIVAALDAGIPITHEKPLALNLAAATRIRDAVRRTGTPFLTNWPTNWQRGRRTILRLVQEGVIGDVWMLKDRQGHAGPREIGCGTEFWTWLYDIDRNGGGAGADFCGYGAAVSAILLGRPESVWGTASNLTKSYDISDDNAIFVAKYPKAVAVLEGTWAQQGGDGAGYPLVYGTKGTLSQTANGVQIATPEGTETVESDPLPAGESNHAECFIHCIENKIEPVGMLGLEVCYMAQEIVEAGYTSARTGENVALTSL